ncbi:membrane protein [Leminorella grimontii]|uniref:Membrane protein n=1 Tax=Leminorella grimontii TaxID=82981 RepID=A0AAV5N1H9_9GAMM|nr:Na/Pi cotransporter family protein [Leminorella grimontii]KFC96825.1 sodium-dependent phosphate transporter [Leminorella grimontii ATCC 33999 = DSM 5078]GKX55971.1 membrane protein [Leminorella grimontii]VFS57561.1 sodium-dependent inorganic phosphate (Pi) transporter [Leminorella grimontii]
MLTLLHLLSSVALLVWGTHIVRTGVMRIFGADLRRALGASVRRKGSAFVAGLGVTALVQSSNATALLVISFVAQGLIGLSPALTILLGADVGTALMARVLTFDLSWLSPLLILFGVIAFLSQKKTRAGQVGRAGIGLGLILLALQLIVISAKPMTEASAVQEVFSSLAGDAILALLIGALFAMLTYSSLAAVLLTATLAATGLVPLNIALSLVIGSNLGSGALAVISSRGQGTTARRLVLGSMLFKVIGCLLVAPWVTMLAQWVKPYGLPAADVVIYFHVVYNLARCLVMLPLVQPVARLMERLLPDEPTTETRLTPRYLDRSALDTPSLALANAVRETLRLGDVISQMLEGFQQVLQGNAQHKRVVTHLKDESDMLYEAIKLYLARLPQESLSDSDSRRWAEIIGTAVNLEQAGDIIYRMAAEVSSKSLNAQRFFSQKGIEDLTTLHARLVKNLDLAMSVFLSGEVDNARRLRRAKHRFRLLNQRYSLAHVERLHQNNLQSMETSSLHMGLLADMKRLNSLFCAVAYYVLEVQDEENADAEAGAA